MRPDIDLPVIIIAGGGAKRFGAAKGLAKIGPRMLLQHVIDAVRAQTTGTICINAEPDSPYAAFGLRTLPDQAFQDCWPLAGLLTALTFANEIGADHVLTVPVDTPFLPPNLVYELVEAGAPAIAASGDRQHPICGLWPSALRADLESALSDGARSVMGWVDRCGARPVTFEKETHVDPFFNVNTQDDLARARRIADDV